MTLKVNFVEDKDSHGTACLIENLLTNEVFLDVSINIFINELEHFINKSTEILKLRYGTDVDVNINWNSLKEEKKNAITSKQTKR